MNRVDLAGDMAQEQVYSLAQHLLELLRQQELLQVHLRLQAVQRIAHHKLQAQLVVQQMQQLYKALKANA